MDKAMDIVTHRPILRDYHLSQIINFFKDEIGPLVHPQESFTKLACSSEVIKLERFWQLVLNGSNNPLIRKGLERYIEMTSHRYQHAVSRISNLIGRFTKIVNDFSYSTTEYDRADRLRFQKEILDSSRQSAFKDSLTRDQPNRSPRDSAREVVDEITASEVSDFLRKLIFILQSEFQPYSRLMDEALCKLMRWPVSTDYQPSQIIGFFNDEIGQLVHAQEEDGPLQPTKLERFWELVPHATRNPLLRMSLGKYIEETSAHYQNSVAPSVTLFEQVSKIVNRFTYSTTEFDLASRLRFQKDKTDFARYNAFNPQRVLEKPNRATSESAPEESGMIKASEVSEFLGYLVHILKNLSVAVTNRHLLGGAMDKVMHWPVSEDYHPSRITDFFHKEICPLSRTKVEDSSKAIKLKIFWKIVLHCSKNPLLRRTWERYLQMTTHRYQNSVVPIAKLFERVISIVNHFPYSTTKFHLGSRLWMGNKRLKLVKSWNLNNRSKT